MWQMAAASASVAARSEYATRSPELARVEPAVPVETGELVERAPDAIDERGRGGGTEVALVAGVVERGGERHRLVGVGDRALGLRPRGLDHADDVREGDRRAVQVVDTRTVQRRPRPADKRAGDVLHVDQVGAPAPAQLVRPSEHRG